MKSAVDTALGTVLRAHWGRPNPSAAAVAIAAQLQAAQTRTAAPTIPKPVRKSLEQVAADLRAQLDQDPELKAEAQQMKSRLEALDQKCQGQMERRCAVSAVHLKALRLALG